MLTADVMELLAKLLVEDEEAQNSLIAKLADVEERLEAVNAQLTQAEAYEKAKKTLTENQGKEIEKTTALEDAKTALDAAQETVPEQEKLGKQITEIELLLPSYDELSQMTTELGNKETA